MEMDVLYNSEEETAFHDQEFYEIKNAICSRLNTEFVGRFLVNDSLRMHLIGFLAIESIPITADSLARAAPIPANTNNNNDVNETEALLNPSNAAFLSSIQVVVRVKGNRIVLSLTSFLMEDEDQISGEVANLSVNVEEEDRLVFEKDEELSTTIQVQKMGLLAAAISDAHLTDFPMSGYAFTWEHGRSSGNLIEEKLDHVLATNSWRRNFSQARAMVLDKSSSDHLPIYLEIRHFVPRAQARRFHFENSWRREAVCKDLIKGCWLETAGMALSERISRCKALLEVWGEELRHYQKGEFATCMAVLAATRSSRTTRDNVRFLEEGDANTRFFHRRASARQQQNRISSLRDESGNCCYLNSGLEDHMPVITEEQNEFLLAPYSIEDVRATVFDMKADKASGLDWFNPGFYQGYWDIIGNDIAQNCIEIIHSGSIPDHLNVIGLVLIPKKSSPESMTDLRPIALCNVLLKIITKLLANHLRNILPLLILESRSAFVAGRNIQDNCILAFEALHAFHRKTRGSNFSTAVKMDISKAYDRMEWSFLRQILTKLGFHALWINLIMSSLTSIKY
ncbi:uncharacterized protein LOC105635438 [Jatropha curcas]|uniref:uncharacterized protein LOC105635438 n=1 Tax=Jatropha curcas TaxID=180498 RepID=UPI0018944070|nr:uncharacterized protein LOC105635438 [Jatropha curcas]